MANEIQKLYDLPDISFVDDISYEQILDEMIGDFEKKYQEETKKKIVLRPGDKEHIHLRILAGQYFQMYQVLDNAAKMNLLKYSKGDFLKHLGRLKGLSYRSRRRRSLLSGSRFPKSEKRLSIFRREPG